MPGGKLARRRRRQRREEARGQERELRGALEELGEALLDARERGVPEALGFPTFAAWARVHIPAIRPEWRLSPEQVDELASRAVKAAGRRRRVAEVQRQAGDIGQMLATIDAERLYTAAGFRLARGLCAGSLRPWPAPSRGPPQGGRGQASGGARMQRSNYRMRARSKEVEAARRRIDEEVAAGRLVIRQATPEERERYGIRSPEEVAGHASEQ